MTHDPTNYQVQARERVCGTCQHYGFRPGNPKGWVWVCCYKTRRYFPDDEPQPGKRPGCEKWEA